MDPLISSKDSNEYVNSLSHLFASILSIACTAMLIVFAALQEKWVHMVSFAIYGCTAFLSFAASTLLHFFLLFKKYRRVFGILDHCAIYLLIAGTYTPFCLAVVGGKLGWTMFAVIWGLALFNIVVKAVFFAMMPPSLSMLSYLIMGWLAMILVYHMYLKLGLSALLLILLGGIFYSVGAIIFYRGKPNPFPPYFGNHEIWHIAVILGYLAMFMVMLYFVLPYS